MHALPALLLQLLDQLLEEDYSAFEHAVVLVAAARVRERRQLDLEELCAAPAWRRVAKEYQWRRQMRAPCCKPS